MKEETNRTMKKYKAHVLDDKKGIVQIGDTIFDTKANLSYKANNKPPKGTWWVEGLIVTHNGKGNIIREVKNTEQTMKRAKDVIEERKSYKELPKWMRKEG